LAVLKSVLAAIKTEGIEAIYSLGNLVGPGGEMDPVIELASQKDIRNVQGPNDREVAESATLDHLRPLNRDRLLLDPLILAFHLGERRAVAFHGGFIQDLPGFSDFSPYATEIIMTCSLSDYLRDESVFPAVTTMTEHFTADLVLFGHTGQWKHVRLGKVDFVNVGALAANGKLGFAILAWQNGGLEVHFRSLPLVQ
jgi:predicted phosphodiesterase